MYVGTLHSFNSLSSYFSSIYTPDVGAHPEKGVLHGTLLYHNDTLVSNPDPPIYAALDVLPVHHLLVIDPLPALWKRGSRHKTINDTYYTRRVSCNDCMMYVIHT